MQKNDAMKSYEKVLNVFADDLKQITNTDFVWSEKFGFLCVSSWSIYNDSAYDVIRIDSVERLCEVLVDMLVYDRLAVMEEICLNEADIQALYREWMQDHVSRLPEYQELLDSKFARSIRPVLCRSADI